MTQNKKLIVNSIGAAIVLVAAFFVVTNRTPQTSEAETQTIAEATVELQTAPIEVEFPDVSVGALAVHVLDVRSGETIYSKNPDEQHALASLTKVMTALVATEESPDPANQIVGIDLAALLTDGESGFWYGEQWNLTELIKFTLVSSSNDGAAAIALALDDIVPEKSFVDLMNAKAIELGLTKTYFVNPTGLDINGETEPGAFGSARDMGTLFAHTLAVHPELLEVTQAPELVVSSLTRAHVVENTNKLASDIPWLLGAKTGFTDHAGGNLVVAFDAGLARPVIVTVLGSTKDGRFEDMQKLIDATLEYVAA